MKFQDLKKWLIDPTTSDQETKVKNKFVKASMEGPSSRLQVIGKSNGLLKGKVNEFYKFNKEFSVFKVMEELELMIDETNLIEAFVIAAYLLGKYKTQFDKAVWDRLNSWIDRVDQWAPADHLCIDVYCHFPVYEDPFYSELFKEVKSENFWRRRIAVVRFVKHIRKNEEATLKMLPLMDEILDDKNYYVRKTIPWLLREGSKSSPNIIKEYILNNHDRIKKIEMKEAMKYIKE